MTYVCSRTIDYLKIGCMIYITVPVFLWPPNCSRRLVALECGLTTPVTSYDKYNVLFFVLVKPFAGS